MIKNSVLFDVRDSTTVVVDSGDNGINCFVTINTGVLSDGGEKLMTLRLRLLSSKRKSFPINICIFSTASFYKK